jgi:hypothetical protein
MTYIEPSTSSYTNSSRVSDCTILFHIQYPSNVEHDWDSNNSHIHGQTHTSRIENLSPSLADPSESNDDNIQVSSDSDYAIPIQRRDPSRKKCKQAKPKKTLL